MTFAAAQMVGPHTVVPTQLPCSNRHFATCPQVPRKTSSQTGAPVRLGRYPVSPYLRARRRTAIVTARAASRDGIGGIGRRPTRGQRPDSLLRVLQVKSKGHRHKDELTSAYPKSNVNAEGIPAPAPQLGRDPRSKQWGTRLWRCIDATKCMIHPH